MKTNTIRKIFAVIAFAFLPIAYLMDVPAWSMGTRFCEPRLNEPDAVSTRKDHRPPNK